MNKIIVNAASRGEFENERIPTLKEAVALCKELGLVMLIELKNTSDIDKVPVYSTQYYSY